MRSAVSLSIAIGPSIRPAPLPVRIRAVNAPALRPLGIGEILDVGIKIYWRNAWTLFRIVVFVVLPAQILVNVIQISALPPGVKSVGTSPFGPSFESNNTLDSRDSVTLAVGYVAAI